MDKHVFLCETESEYESLVYETPHVALTEDDDVVHYDEASENKEYKYLDILWNDGKVTAEIREPEGDLAPVAICVIPTDYLGRKEKARFMSLLYVDKTGKGSASEVSMNWGPDSPSENDPLANMYTMLMCKNVTNPSIDITESFVWNNSSISNTCPNLRYNEEGTAWKNAKQYLSDPEKKYIVGDIYGKNNTKRIWETLDFAGNTNYAFVNLKNFNPYNLDLEWYIPAGGELANMMFNTGYDKYTANGNKFPEGSLCNIMGKISAKYPGKSASRISDGDDHWSSSPIDTTDAACFCSGNTNVCVGNFYDRTTGGASVLAFVQL